MTVLLIGSINNDTWRLQQFFKRMTLTSVHYYIDCDELFTQHTTSFYASVQLIVYDANLHTRNLEQHGREIERLIAHFQAPILLSTTYHQPILLDRIFEFGIFDVLLKPFDYMHVKIRVQVALQYAKEAALRKQHEHKLKQDLAIAKDIQKNALTPPLVNNVVECHGMYVTSQSLGGDMYCWYRISDDLTAIMLYDVMGHGVAAALVTMSIRSLLKGIMTKLIDPVAVINELNRQIHELFTTDDIDDFLVTAIYLLIDRKNQTLQYVNASHTTGILFGKYGETVTLTSNTAILGLFPTIKTQAKTIRLTGWHRIILYTDGLLHIQQNKHAIFSFFYQYASLPNHYALRKFSEKYELSYQYFEDDVTIVSITITL